MKEQTKRINKLWIIFFLGVMIGCVCINLYARGDKEIVEQLNIYLEQFPEGLKQKDTFYIAEKRIKQLLFILILYVTISKKFIVRVITFLFGTILGMYLSVDDAYRNVWWCLYTYVVLSTLYFLCICY